MLVRLQARALAIALPLLWLEMAVIGRLERYPFLDLRTSQFLLVSSLFVVALGAVGLVLAAALRWCRWWRGPLGVAAAVVVGGALAVFVRASASCRTSARSTSRARTCEPRRRRSPRTYARDDVMLVNQSANFGFSYYWPHGQDRLSPRRFRTGFLDESRQPATTRSTPDARRAGDVRESLSQAVARWRHGRTGAAGCSSSAPT